MTTKTKAARRSCNYDTRQNVHSHKDTTIIQQQFERGSMIAAIVMALFFGAAVALLPARRDGHAKGVRLHYPDGQYHVL